MKRTDKPFRITMSDGKIFTFKDPAAIKLTGGLDPTNPAQFASLIVGDDKERAAFVNHPEVDGYFFVQVLEKWLEHYA